MTLLADLTAGVPSTAADRLRRRWRSAPLGTGVVTGGDVVRLAATLAAVGALVGALDLVAPQAPPADGTRTLETSYGLVALGHVQVEAELPSAPLDGTQRVTVPVTLHNLSDEAVHYGPEHFRLHTGSTSARPEAGSVRTGEVAPDGAVQLRLVFDVPRTARARLTVDEARTPSGLQVRLAPPPAR